jgi:hypothetical protein
MEHRERKEQSKLRKRHKRGAIHEDRRGFKMDGEGTPVRADDKRFIHVAQAYQAQGNPDIAYDLVRELRPRHRRAVLGAKLFKSRVNYATEGTAHA